MSRVCAAARKNGLRPVQSYAVVAETAEAALAKIEERQPGVPAEFLAVHEEPYGIALGRRSDMSEADLEQVRATAAFLRDPLSWRPRARKAAGPVPSAVPSAVLGPDGRRVGGSQLRLLRLLRDRGPWHRGCGWHGCGDYETSKLADALLERGLAREDGRVSARVRRKGLPVDMAPTEFVLRYAASEEGLAVLALHEGLARAAGAGS